MKVVLPRKQDNHNFFHIEKNDNKSLKKYKDEIDRLEDILSNYLFTYKKRKQIHNELKKNL